MKRKVVWERIIAEQTEGGAWLVMWPDGNVEGFNTQKQVLKAVGKRIGPADVMVSTIEWNHR